MFDEFKALVREDFEELSQTGTLRRARELSSDTQVFESEQFPQYFTGRLDANVVLIHLNPGKMSAAYPARWQSFEDYFDFHEHFGRRCYGKGSPRGKKGYKSRFDWRQLAFLKQLGVINFLEERTEDDRYTNLETSIDEKLQLELIPYRSDRFDASALPPAELAPYLERILELIARSHRDFVLFCGSVFETILRSATSDRLNVECIKTCKFNLKKRDGNLTRNAARFANVSIEFDGRSIRAGIAHSYAQQGLPAEEYGKQVRALYDRN